MSQTVIITGANSGLGLWTAKEISSTSDWFIVYACRSEKTAQEAIEALPKESQKRALFLKLDLGSLTSIRRFVKEFRDKKELPPLKTLVCNAGVQFMDVQNKTEDGFESTFGINHLGHFLLANLLLKCLKPNSRIIFVSSGTHDPAQKTAMPEPIYTNSRSLAYPPADSTDSERIRGQRAYTTSKLCNVLCTYELNRRLHDIGREDISVNAYDPGLIIGTGLVRENSYIIQFLWYYILPYFARWIPHTRYHFAIILHLQRSIEDSSRALARLAISKETERITGKYFAGFDEIPSSKDSMNREFALDLWKTSVDLVGLKADETIIPFDS